MTTKRPYNLYKFDKNMMAVAKQMSYVTVTFLLLDNCILLYNTNKPPAQENNKTSIQ